MKVRYIQGPGYSGEEQLKKECLTHYMVTFSHTSVLSDFMIGYLLLSSSDIDSCGVSLSRLPLVDGPADGMLIENVVSEVGYASMERLQI